MKQITDTILMVRPVAFRTNVQTVANNYFQADLALEDEKNNQKAQAEFDAFVDKLRSVGVTVIVAHDKKELNTPNSIFPNNWVSFHHTGMVALFPMFAPNRRAERREDILEQIANEGYEFGECFDYTENEEQGVFLEGMASMILDRANAVAYCALSSRSDEDLFIEYCEDFEFTPVVFKAFHTVENKRLPICHTNIMMSIAQGFAVICLDSIDDKKQRKQVVEFLKNTGKEIIEISEAQMHQFAANVLEVQGAKSSYLVMSTTAYKSLTLQQIAKIEKHCSILAADIHTIETCGGGSARCMLAEVFLPKEEA